MTWQLTLPVSDDLGCLWKFLTIVWSVGAHYLWEKLPELSGRISTETSSGWNSPMGLYFYNIPEPLPLPFCFWDTISVFPFYFSNKSTSLENFLSRKMPRFMNNVMPWETHFVVNIWKKNTSVRWTVGKGGSCHLCTTWQLDSWAMHRHLASC